MATKINYDNYHNIIKPDLGCLTSFEYKIWTCFNDENYTPRLIADKFDTDIDTTVTFINAIIAKLLRAQENNEDDLNERKLQIRLNLVKARNVARETGSNELLIMSEV